MSTNALDTCRQAPGHGSQLPTVAVVVATYLRAEGLPTLVRLTLDDPAVTELIVVVDGCSDGSYECLTGLAAHEERLRPLFVEHRGHLGAVEAGVRAAGSDVIVLLDDDVLPRPGLFTKHARHHVGTSRKVVLGYMPVSVPARRGRGDVATFLYAAEYERHCARLEQSRDEVLENLWGGNVSLQREDCLAVGVKSDEFDTFYFSDREFGIRLAEAGMVGVFDPNLAATHLHRRDARGFVDDAVSQGMGMALLHRIHAERLGPFEETSLYGDLPIGIRWFVRRFGRGVLSRPVALVLMEAGVALGAIRAFRLQTACARLARRLCQLRGFVAQKRSRPSFPRSGTGRFALRSERQ